MYDSRQSILVFGATGRQGGSVARALLDAKWPVRALVRDPSAPKAIALGEAGVEILQGSLADTDVIRTAMEDVYGVFSVLPGNLPGEDEVRFGCMVADLAAKSGVAHFVYSSGASAGNKLTGVPRFDAKPRIEAHIRKLPLTATIVRPMIFMDMLIRAEYGLNEGRYTFFLRQHQSMQLIAGDDIGKFVEVIFADKTRFEGITLKLASDTVTGNELEKYLTEAAGRTITYAQFDEKFLAANPDLNHMSKSLESGPLADHVDLKVMRDINPGISSFPFWLAGSGRTALERALSATEKRNQS